MSQLGKFFLEGANAQKRETEIEQTTENYIETWKTRTERNREREREREQER